MEHDQEGALSFQAYATVAIDQRATRPLDYGIPQDLLSNIEQGTRVLVPLRSQLLKATVLHVRKRTAIKGKVQPIKEVLESLPKELMELARWMARYYATPERKILQSIMPASVRKNTKPKEQLFIKRAKSLTELTELCKELREKKPQQALVLDEVLVNPKGMFLSQLLEKVSRSPIDSLIKSGALTCQKVHVDRSELLDEEFFQTRPKTLNDEQAAALKGITENSGTHLIYGVTGSGKTEIYLQAIQHYLDKGMGTILLVPEIALTAQTIERLKSRLQCRIAILHHRLSDGERYDAWHRIRSGEIPVVVGARSAIFSPVKNLGLIIVDEEQESSYKQSDEMPCYHARDIAILRGKLTGATVALGSATPAFETYTNALSGKYQLHKLTRRATKSSLPKMTIVDMKIERERLKNYSPFSELLLSKINDRCAKGEQTILFLNRRGTYSTQLCGSCGENVSCKHCDVTMTFHRKENLLCCHLCGANMRPPTACPSCKSHDTLKFRGPGTQQIEQNLLAVYPEIRTLRMDADTTRHKGAHDKLFKQFRSGKADVLIGTQMIAKGLHFPSVTLVGILSVDGTLNIPDFRSHEYAYQLLTQVAGRSGRADLPGEVVIQTNVPDNLAITATDFDAFYKEEIASRQFFDYPPHSHMARFILSGPEEEPLRTYSTKLQTALANQLPSTYTIFPPQPCGYARIKDTFRYHILVKGPSPFPISDFAARLSAPRPMKLLYDINPTSTYF
ncbi:MAG: primosomal protein N' [Simkaniaceae bacterium]|nr:primosomal protein N' [Simkaniaceae bacterium]